MSRAVKRVPADFSWELGQVWEGYIHPEELRLPSCTACVYDSDRPTGYSPEAYAVASTFSPSHIQWGWEPGEKERAESLAWHDKIGQLEVDNLIRRGRLTDLTHRWDPVTEKFTPRGGAVTAAQVNALQHSNGMQSHDDINRVILIEFRCQVLGIRMACSVCAGARNVGSDEQRAAYNAWERTEPPAGEGWQLWETVSEGSPVSPVFNSGENLALWMASLSHDDFSYAPLETAMRFILGDGQSPSFITSDTTVVTGVQATEFSASTVDDINVDVDTGNHGNNSDDVNISNNSDDTGNNESADVVAK